MGYYTRHILRNYNPFPLNKKFPHSGSTVLTINQPKPVFQGIPKFIANLTNAYTKYFNTKHQRIGPLFEGVFKAVYIESDEQLLHISRYIHLNPITSSIVEDDRLDTYQWSSYPEYLSSSGEEIAQKDLILSMFKSTDSYQEFITDQIDYAKQLETIEHLILE